jgi:4-hydroxy-tetrahydrodipicolinate synthase
MKLFTGVYTALVTPFYQGKIDFDSLEKIIAQQIKAGIAGFVVNGTTAESPTLSEGESFELLKFVQDKAAGKARIVFGSGSNSTAKTIELSKKAEAAGAEGLLVVVPYYNKPTQRGLKEHFTAVAKSTALPVMLYNVPGRTVTSLNLETIKSLSEVKNIVAIKEATGDVGFGRQVILAAGADFIVSSGDDESCLELRNFGGQGTVAVCSHILPKKMANWFHDEMNEKFLLEFAEAKPLISSIYISTNPIGVKGALHILGTIRSDEMRLPMTTLEPEQRRTLEAQLKKYERFLG